MKYVPVFKDEKGKEYHGADFEAANIDVALEQAQKKFGDKLVAVERYCGRNGGWW